MLLKHDIDHTNVFMLLNYIDILQPAAENCDDDRFVLMQLE
jgi:hypothetical protein